jgi:hypothetical protein
LGKAIAARIGVPWEGLDPDEILAIDSTHDH